MTRRIPPVVVLSRPTAIHTHACANCPSTQPLDPEAADALAAPEPPPAFACAWRPNKLCRGYCDLLEANAEGCSLARAALDPSLR